MTIRTAVLVCLAVVLAGCSTVPITGRRQLSLVSSAELTTMSVQSFNQLISESKLSADTAKTAMVTRVGQNIARSAEVFLRENGMQGELSNYQWEFKLIEEDKTINAFCMPGGKIAVYTGILPVTKDEAGLAVVIGHEVAHAIANHSGERMSQLLLTQLGGAALSTAMKNKPEKTQQLAMAAYGLGANIGIMLPYSRNHEYEADHIGLILMARAGYDPSAAVTFWQRMSSLGGGAATPEFLSTHPADASRIEAIKSELPEAQKYYRK
jgi:predicted Zn-dependent protease